MRRAFLARPVILVPSLALILVMGACTTSTSDGPSSSPATAVTGSPTTAAPPAPPPSVVLGGTDRATLALEASRAFFAVAPTVVVAPTADDAQVTAAAALGSAWATPVLLDGDAAGLATELERLGARTVVAVGGATVAADPAYTVSRDASAERPSEPATALPAPPTLTLTTGDVSQAAPAATAAAAGAHVVVAPTGDVRGSRESIDAVKANPERRVVALGGALGTDLDAKLATARSAPELPGGGQVLFPGRRMVALYGSAEGPALGVLGEQGPAASVRRAKKLAARYQKFSDEPVVPAFELIATVASAGAGRDKTYSRKASVASLRPYVDAARAAGIYVVLDLQPGREDFVTQAKRYASLLRQPHVGLALDPEWRLKKKQKHLRQIGSVKVAEVNRVVDWLAGLTRDEVLPQKLLVLHQFQRRMISHRERLDTSRSELSILIHADGQGSQPAKRATWRALREDAPAGVFWGWKNFLDEDTPTLSPRKTYTTVRPRPEFVSYQ